MEELMDQSEKGADASGEMSEDDLSHTIDKAIDSGGTVSESKADRFYDRLRGSVASYLERKGSAVGKAGEFLLLVPDVFMLLWRLTKDGRVQGKHKVLLISGLAYFVSPIDFMPEAILGPIGYLDDLVFGVYILNKVMADTDVAIVREHWSGSEDILESIQRVLSAADGLVGSKFVAKIKQMVK
jgi:uncharacterized membrane protein YkvA (DUF1232 family)